MHFIIRPIVRLSNRLSSVQKLAVNTAIVVVVLLVAINKYLSVASGAIASIQAEQQSLDQALGLIRLLRDIIDSRTGVIVTSVETASIVPITAQNVENRVQRVFSLPGEQGSALPRSVGADIQRLVRLGERAPKASYFGAYSSLANSVRERIEDTGRMGRNVGAKTVLPHVPETLTRDFPVLLDNAAKQVAAESLQDPALLAYAPSAQLIVLDALDRVASGMKDLRQVGIVDDRLGARFAQLHALVLAFEDADASIRARAARTATGAQIVGRGFDLLEDTVRASIGHLESRLVSERRMRTLYTAAALILASLIVAMSVASSIAIRRSLLALTQGTVAFREGNLHSRVTVESNDEFAIVANNFNRVADQFNNVLEDLQAANARTQHELETQVVIRTKELSRTNEELSTALAELKRTQQVLVQAEKMAALGGLVAGVAHEINTPIGLAYTTVTYLQGQWRNLLAQVEKGNLTEEAFGRVAQVIEEALRQAVRNLERAAELIRSFKQVAVDRTADRRRCFRLKVVVEELVRSVSSILRPGGHRVVVDVDAGIEFDSYPGALGQVLTNLIVNAVKHGFDRSRAGTIAIVAAAAGDGQCEIRVSDDGCGIPDDALGKVFEPFYTTKRGAGGSGLGLSIVYNLITQRLGGSITVGNAGGAAFAMRLPLVAPT